MMKKKLCFTLITFLIDFIYTAEVPTLIKNDDRNKNNKIFQKEVLHCGLNEIINTEKIVCEPTCVPSPPSLQCLDKTISLCVCLKGYVRNNLKRCVLLTECSQEEYSKDILKPETNFNFTQTASFKENQNITSIDDDQIIDNLLENLELKLTHFVRLLKSKVKTNSTRTVRNTDNTNQYDQNSYKIYEKLLRASSDQAAEPDSNL